MHRNAPGSHAEPVARMRATLEPLIHDPDAYWPTLVILLQQDLGVLDEVHRAECQQPTGCRTCAELATTWVMLDAHDELQPSGCACPDHITYPLRPTSGVMTASTPTVTPEPPAPGTAPCAARRPRPGRTPAPEWSGA